MLAKVFLDSMKAHLLKRKDVVAQSLSLPYKTRVDELVWFASANIEEHDRVLLIRAGIHGEEIAGPYSLLEYADEIFSKAHEKGIKIILFPLGNPSGFELGTRYNVDHDKGDAGNGDFMRYECMDGSLVDDLGSNSDVSFKNWYWSSDPSLDVQLPVETSQMHVALRTLPLTQVVGCLDLHQDYITQGSIAGAYHYGFDNLDEYDGIINEIKEIVPILSNARIGAGFHVALKEDGSVPTEVANNECMTSDAYGFIVRHDGSLPDLFFRLGARYAVTVETMGAVPLRIAMEVNRIWMLGFIDLVSKI